MKTPPLLVGLSLLFWGWQTGLWPFAVPIAVLLEAGRWLPWRLQLTLKEIRRIWDVSALSFTATIIYMWNTDEVAAAVLSAVQWLPIFMFPIVAAQAYADDARINRTTFFWLLRRYSRPETLEERLDVSFGYVGICILGASAANVRNSGFYIGLCVIIGIALWANRARRVFAPLTVALFALAVVLGLIGSSWIRNLHANLEHRTAEWLASWGPPDFNEVEGITRLGGMAPLKLSGSVVLRIHGEIPVHPPELLRQFTFTRYDAGAWYSPRREYRPVLEEGVASWTLAQERAVRRSAIISMSLPRRRMFVPAPVGTARLSEFPAAELECSRVATIRAMSPPENVNYRVHYGPGAGPDAPPDRHDFEVPSQESRTIRELAAELKLHNEQPEQALLTVANWFQQKFHYSLEGIGLRYSAGNMNESRLAHFLHQSRKGHCEYFATAGALLLRAAGIPTRYVTGYSVQEPSPSGKHYVVRHRHAHAWVIAYINGRWTDFDPTPQAWEQLESDQASFWRPLSDWWSDLRFLYALWRWEDKTGLPKQYLFAPLFLLGTFVAWKLVARNHRKPLLKSSRKEAAAGAAPGHDSEFYLIEKVLRKKGFDRRPGETPAAWVARVKRADLNDIIDLHYRYRFDSLSAEDRARLSGRAQTWLAAERRTAN